MVDTLIQPQGEQERDTGLGAHSPVIQNEGRIPDNSGDSGDIDSILKEVKESEAQISESPNNDTPWIAPDTRGEDADYKPTNGDISEHSGIYSSNIQNEKPEPKEATPTASEAALKSLAPEEESTGTTPTTPVETEPATQEEPIEIDSAFKAEEKTPTGFVPVQERAKKDPVLRKAMEYGGSNENHLDFSVKKNPDAPPRIRKPEKSEEALEPAPKTTIEELRELKEQRDELIKKAREELEVLGRQIEGAQHTRDEALEVAQKEYDAQIAEAEAKIAEKRKEIEEEYARTIGEANERATELEEVISEG